MGKDIRGTNANCVVDIQGRQDAFPPAVSAISFQHPSSVVNLAHRECDVLVFPSLF